MIAKIGLLLAAFGLIALATNITTMGAPPPKHVSADQLANEPESSSVTLVGVVVDRTPTRSGMSLTVQNTQGFQSSVLITDEARVGAIQMGERYQFTGQTFGSGAVSVSTPCSVKLLIGDLDTSTRTMQVKDEIAYERNSFGTYQVAAPGVPDGVWPLHVVSNGKRSVATLVEDVQ